MTFHFFHSAHQNDPIYHSEWSASLKNNRDRGARKNGTVLPHQNRRLQRTCFVNQALSLLFHPFLIVVFHVLFVLPTTAVRLSHRRRIMGEVCVAVITIKFRHVAPQAVGNSVPRRLEVTRSVSADAAEVTSQTQLQKSNPSHPILQLRCSGGACTAHLLT